MIAVTYLGLQSNVLICLFTVLNEIQTAFRYESVTFARLTHATTKNYYQSAEPGITHVFATI